MKKCPREELVKMDPGLFLLSENVQLIYRFQRMLVIMLLCLPVEEGPSLGLEPSQSGVVVAVVEGV